MANSKKAKAEQSVLDLLIEASAAAAVLITRRRRLFRTGGSMYVGELLRKDGKIWLKAAIPVASVERNSWDLAHETVARYKKEFGQSPYIEPDRAGGRYDALVQCGKSKDPLMSPMEGAPGRSPWDPNAMIESLMPKIPHVGLAGNMGIPGIGGRGNGGLGGFGIPDLTMGMGHSPSQFGPAGQSQDVMQLFQQAGLSGSEELESSVPALRALPGFEELSVNLARMLEVEASQLLLSQMPGVPVSAHNRDSLVAIAKLPECSRALRSFLSGIQTTDEAG
ncbi:MAG: hypothetical protein JNN26_16315 [Candidatus Obscuribacter sp.]|nr:hypothetical protein [Candidatus Obscuribacter sp.]